MGFLSLGSIVYGFIFRNAFAFALGGVGLLIFAALLLSGVEVDNGIEKVADGPTTLLFKHFFISHYRLEYFLLDT